MCELWQSRIHDSPSDGVAENVLVAMNRVTLDIVGLVSEMPLDSLDFSSCYYVPNWIGILTRRLCFFSPSSGLDATLTR